MTRLKHGWQPDLPDHRDYMVAHTPEMLVGLPTQVDLRAHDTPIYDQGNLGSCTGNAIAGAYAFDLKQQGKQPVFAPSRLFIYYNERVIEKTVKQDAGAMIRDGIKSINTTGVCDETLWPYKVSKFKTKPSVTSYKQAAAHKSVKYARVPQDEQNIKATLSQGYPVVFGFTVYDSFESDAVAQTGIVPMPGQYEQVLGGHAVVAVGYNTDHFIVRNSWGPGWGDNGYFYMPYAYLTNNNLADDLWVVNTVE